MHYGLSLKQLLTLAYEYAESSGCNYPKSWKENKCGGKDWAAGFRKRNPELSGFSKPGIWPINKLVFGDDDFAPIDIFSTGYHDLTDENTHNTQDLHFVDSEASQNNEVVDREQNKTPTLDADPVSVSDADDPLHVSSSKAILTPEVVRPYPKKAITDSVLKRKGREKGRSRIYTETPEKID
ncbi:hypothetical protein HHI36_014472 [Cryptolaemus montrouzieri]|uniref:Uncharacterized protein n=1 Tax=Cryptolaemus montrouzieri TaxID=559131 RepID=A0ABD2N2S6_9CUCU